MGGARAGVRDGTDPDRAACRIGGRRRRGPALTLTLVAAGRTGPNRSSTFGGEGGPLDARGRRDILALVGGRGPVVSGPEQSVVESAALLADHVVVDHGLRSLDVGRWHGVRPEDIARDDLATWFTDPDATPHAGESITQFVARVRVRLAALGGRSATVVAAKPVVQAAVAMHRGVGAGGYLGVDIAPASVWTVIVP